MKRQSQRRFIPHAFLTARFARCSSQEEVESEEETEQPKGKSGFHKLNALSPQLSEFLGVERASRPDIVKRMWAYFKEHNLQNPKDKRQILLDDALQKVFKVKKFTMFTLNRHVAKHVYIEEEVRRSDRTRTKPSEERSDELGIR